MITYLEALFIAFLILNSWSCKQRPNENDPIIQIDIGNNMSNMQQVNLTRFVDNIRYVPLENTKELLVGGKFTPVFSKDFILINGLDACLLYDYQGHYIKSIGKKGRGPGEYEYISVIGIADNKIYLNSLYDLFEFNTDGSFKKKYPKLFLVNNDDYMYTVFLLRDSMFFGIIPNSTGQKQFKALLVDKHGNIQHSYKNFVLFKKERETANSLEGTAQIYQYRDEVFYKEFYNDTLFFLDEQLNLKARYYFNLGKFKEPLSERAAISHHSMFKNIYLPKVFQIGDFLLLDCSFGSHFPVKRLTQKSEYFNGIRFDSWYNSTQILGIFDNKSSELVFCKPTSTDNKLFTTGLYNDFDAGPRFMPEFVVNDSTLLMILNPKDLKDHLSSDEFKNNVTKYPEKKKELERLGNSLNELDNPILMFVTFKN